MDKQITHKINLYSLYALAFALPFYKKATPILIIVFLVTSLINGNYRFKNKGKNILLFTVLYVAYLIGLLYSENLKYGLSDMETKLSIFIFPIAFFISKIDFKAILDNVLKWFVIGLTISCIICLGEGIYQFVISGNESELFYSKLSIFHHASYYSMYVNLGLIIVYYQYFKKESLIKLDGVKMVLLSVFLSIVILLLSSKMGIISMLITQLAVVIYWVVKYKSYFKSLLVILVFIAGIAITYSSSYTFKVRMDEFITTLKSDEASKKSTTGVRIYAWQTAIDLIKEKPLIGYGTGDVKNVLIDEYIKKDLTVLAKKELNPHNQFLQTAIALGCIGFLILILSFVLPLIHSIKRQFYIYAFFIGLFLLNNLTESMLETQSGVIFYGFFNALFFVSYFDNSKNKEL